jgi:hypothetical protein
MSAFWLCLALAGAGLAQDRGPVPSEAAVKEAEKLIRDIFKDDYARKSQADRSLLAQKLLKQSAENKDDQAALYVLLRDALDLATQAGDAATSLSALEKLTARFEVNALALKLSTIGALGRFARTPEAVRESIKAHLELADEAVRQDDLDTADKACELAFAVAKSSKDIPSITRVDAKRKDVKETKAAADKVKAARAALAASQEDPAANELVGRYECFVRGNWTAGLPLLAKAAAADLKDLAALDLGAPKEPADQVKLGDAWWDRGEKEAEPAKTKARGRAAYWYAQALPSLSGLSRVRLEKRMAEAPAPPPLPAATGITAGLVGWWRFEEGNGTSAADSSGAKQDLQLVNGVRWVPGRIGGAVELDGVDDHGLGVLTRAPALESPVTLAWFQKIPLGDRGGACMISLCGERPRSALQAGARGRSVVMWQFGGVEYLRFVPTNDGNWIHLAYTYDGQNHHLYEAGELKAVSSQPTQTGPAIRFDLGRWGGGTGTQPSGYTRGALDEIRLYNRALTAAEIKSLAELK